VLMKNAPVEGHEQIVMLSCEGEKFSIPNRLHAEQIDVIDAVTFEKRSQRNGDVFVEQDVQRLGCLRKERLEAFDRQFEHSLCLVERNVVVVGKLKNRLARVDVVEHVLHGNARSVEADRAADAVIVLPNQGSMFTRV
jgi:hypothetical protein